MKYIKNVAGWFIGLLLGLFISTNASQATHTQYTKADFKAYESQSWVTHPKIGKILVVNEVMGMFVYPDTYEFFPKEDVVMIPTGPKFPFGVYSDFVLTYAVLPEPYKEFRNYARNYDEIKKKLIGQKVINKRE